MDELFGMIATTAGFLDVVETPFGEVTVEVTAAGALRAIHFPGAKRQGVKDATRCEAVVSQLKEYFDGQRQTFELPLALEGTPFQTSVWQALGDIPYGKTISYQTLARRIGNPKAARAVGSANGANPIPIVVPCHRVITSDHRLGGYAGGLDVKRHLLQLEGTLPELF